MLRLDLAHLEHAEVGDDVQPDQRLVPLAGDRSQVIGAGQPAGDVVRHRLRLPGDVHAEREVAQRGVELVDGLAAGGGVDVVAASVAAGVAALVAAVLALAQPALALAAPPHAPIQTMKSTSATYRPNPTYMMFQNVSQLGQ